MPIRSEWFRKSCDVDVEDAPVSVNPVSSVPPEVLAARQAPASLKKQETKVDNDTSVDDQLERLRLAAFLSAGLELND